MKPVRFIHGTPEDQEILLLWRAGKDTCDIAKQLWVDESHIANRLPHILQRDRQDQEWNFDSLKRQPDPAASSIGAPLS